MCLKFKNTFRKIKNNKARKTGMIHDLPDERDHIMNVGNLDEHSEDLTPYTSTVKNQGGAQSCTAHAAMLCYETEHFIKNGERFWIEGSEQHNYYNARVIGGLFPADGGAYLRDACKVMAKTGVCPEKLMPYHDSHINSEPGMMTDVMANLWKIKEYCRVTSINGMKRELNKKHPVMIGTPIYSNWIGLTTDTVPMPNNSMIGGHAYLIIGFDDTKGAFRIQNSWGMSWAEGGRAWLPYEFFNHIDWFDAWTVRI